MADDEEVKPLTTATTNYGWVKPDVGGSDDLWGGLLNFDLDGIDSVVHGIQTSVPAPYVLPIASTTVLGGTKVDGTTIHAAADGTLSGTPSSGPPVTISDVAPGSPQVGALWYDSVGGQLYTWFNDGNSTQWVVANNPGVGQGAYLPLNGGVLSGPVSGPSATFANLSAPQAIGDNRVINGNFAINQRGYVSGTALPASPTVANGYGHDRWKAGASGCTYTFTATLPDTTITITANTLTQIIEAGMIEGGVYTLSWTGTAQARVYQGTPTGSYAASPVVTASLTAGTNTIVEFNAGTVGKVKLEIGSVATPFNRQSLAKSMADCQRYYCTIDFVMKFYGGAAINTGQSVTLPVAMRAAPTTVIVGPTYVNSSGLTLGNGSTQYPHFYVQATGTGATGVNATITASAEL